MPWLKKENFSARIVEIPGNCLLAHPGLPPARLAEVQTFTARLMTGAVPAEGPGRVKEFAGEAAEGTAADAVIGNSK